MTEHDTRREHAAQSTAARVLDHVRDYPEVSVRDLGTFLGIGRSTAARAVHRLIDEGRVRIVRPGTSATVPTIYEVTD